MRVEVTEGEWHGEPCYYVEIEGRIITGRDEGIIREMARRVNTWERMREALERISQEARKATAAPITRVLMLEEIQNLAAAALMAAKEKP